MEPKTKVRWVDEKRVYVETPQGDDFIVGFPDESLYRCQKQASWFQVDKFVASLFDKYYEGDASVIMGEINRQMLINHVVQSSLTIPLTRSPFQRSVSV